MPQLLESVMLICFGISWPISLAKNIKAKSAKNMSLPFILMIIVGYCAGITAKLIAGSITYVLAIYLLNLAIVSCNLAVYFFNVKRDRETENPHSETLTRFNNLHRTRVCPISHQELIYKEMNAMASHGNIVFFGSNTFADLPTDELSHTLQSKIYNRSIKNLSIDALSEALKTCVLDLEPSKVFLNIGDVDLQSESFNIDEFLETYHWMLYTIHAKTKASIYIVSVMTDSPTGNELNQKLKALARDAGIEFIDASYIIGTEMPYLGLFEHLKFYMRSHPISFGDAMSFAR